MAVQEKETTKHQS